MLVLVNRLGVVLPVPAAGASCRLGARAAGGSCRLGLLQHVPVTGLVLCWRC
ncbi:hypothetical protein PR002_g25096 [Phytophthora rubi]|uniref:Uncharacterized protein n=1 Tax=Phytophthora rubi TaxID=129364 RepID=A0A6A3I2M2_9STRA|nr:hypothetical protein PR002_g25096 [Phytophthora rubi]